MGIPPWLAQLTGAYGQQMTHADPSMGMGGAGAPTIMDALGGVGHDMMEHYRAGPGVNGAGPTAAAGGALTPPAPAAGLVGPTQPLTTMPHPAGPNLAPPPLISSPVNIAQILAALSGPTGGTFR